MVESIYTNNPESFVPVEYWRDGEPEQPWCQLRASYYGSTYTPHLVIDGIVDAGYDPSEYVAEFNNRASVPTDVTVELSGGPANAPINWEFTVRVCIEVGGQAKDMRVYLIEVNDDYPSYPTYARNTFRQAASTEDVSLAAGQCADVVRKINFDRTTVSFRDGARMVAWAQEPVSPPPGSVAAEIFQTAIMAVANLPWNYAGFEAGDFSEWSGVGP